MLRCSRGGAQIDAQRHDESICQPSEFKRERPAKEAMADRDQRSNSPFCLGFLSVFNGSVRQPLNIETSCIGCLIFMTADQTIRSVV
jgi:hypothetical protein